MGTKERRERIKQATRQGILDGARKIAQQEGWPALTIRKVAEYIEYSPSMVYEYFASKDDILQALLQAGFDELAHAMGRAQQSTDDATEQGLRISDAYWQFAKTNPDLYQVMHGLAGVAIDGAVRAEAVKKVCEIAESTLIAWARQHNVPLNDPLGNTEILWSLLHGLVSLTLIDRIDDDQARAQHLLHNGVQALLQGWIAAASST